MEASNLSFDSQATQSLNIWDSDDVSVPVPPKLREFLGRDDYTPSEMSVWWPRVVCF